jgi:hypothetical protein
MHLFVMAGLVPAIHVFLAAIASGRDARVSAGHFRRHCEEPLRRSNPACMRVAGLLRTPDAHSRDPVARNDVEGPAETREFSEALANGEKTISLVSMLKAIGRQNTQLALFT